MEIVGAVSAAASLVGFMSKSLETIADRSRAFENYQARLKTYHSRLDTERNRLAAWCQKWNQSQVIDREGAEARWTQAGWLEISNTISCIERELGRIQFYLEGSDVLNRQDTLQWRSMVSASAREQAGSPLQSSHPGPGRFRSALRSLRRTGSRRRRNVIERICFAVCDNGDLQQRLLTLKNLVDELYVNSTLRFRAARGRWEDRDVTEEEITRFDELHQRFERFWTNLSTAHARLAGDDMTWSMLLLPQAPFEPELEQCNQLELEFLYSDEFDAHQESYLVPALYVFAEDYIDDESLYSRIVTNKAALLSNKQMAYLQESLKTILLMINNQNEEIQHQMRTRTRADRARAALCIATWVVSIWQSTWVRSLCNCAIRHAIMVDDRRIPAIGSIHNHENEACFDAAIESRQHLLLGRVLAEIALGQPLIARTSGGSTRFYLANENEAVATSRLLVKVRQATSISYRNAVAYCFERDNHAERQHVFGAEDIRGYTDVVIKPLRRYHGDCVKNQNAQHLLHQELASRTGHLLPDASTAISVS